MRKEEYAFSLPAADLLHVIGDMMMLLNAEPFEFKSNAEVTVERSTPRHSSSQVATTISTTNK